VKPPDNVTNCLIPYPHMTCPLVALVLLSLLVPTVSKGFLSEGKHRLDADGIHAELSKAMGSVLGCGGHIGEEELRGIEYELQPIWQALHKPTQDHIERRSLRYLVHRFFDRRSALHIRGFEPSRPMNSSGWGDTDILSQRVPAYVEAVLESEHKLARGFTFRDAVYMVATIKQLIFDSEGALLEKAYKTKHKSVTRSLSLKELRHVLEAYLVNWFVGDDEESIEILLSNRSLLEASIPHWDKIVSMAEGQARAMEYKRQRNPLAALADASARPGHNALMSQYSFEDMHRVIGAVTTSFASFWESECQFMKNALVEMDTHHTGRVPLSKFYSGTLDGEWRFGESESYLRELGALDETGWRGKQVIIANYIQGASNCIVSQSHYLVCCVNECEALLGELEVAIAAPVASPQRILEIVRSMTLDEDLSPALQVQLEKIGTTHDGLVPLHGRLFAQWLHYVFPRECPFPHKAGTAAKLTPMEYGDQHLVEEEDVRRHALEANSSDLSAEVGRDDLQWMSQWSPEEELVSDTVMRGFRAPWEGRGYVASTAVLLLLVGFLGLLRSKGKPINKADDWSSAHTKSHYV